MRRTVLAIVFALIGLGASLASLIDSVGAHPTFCAETGCATVRASAWAHPLGIPMPVFGIAYFIVMLALAVRPAPRPEPMPAAGEPASAAPRLRRVLAIVGGLGGLGLIAIQAFSIHTWCKLCLVADPSAILHAVVVLAGASTIRLTVPRAVLAVPALGAIVLGLALWTHGPASAATGPDLPEPVARLQVPGKVTIVEFVDFECPFCRDLNPKLSFALAKTQAPVAVVRKMVPLPKHPHALPAALAWCCADAQGHGDEMASALFSVEPDQLTPEHCEQLAVRAGCDLARYRATLVDPATRARIDRDVADAKASGVTGFPTIYIGSQVVEGADHTTDELLAMIERART